MRRLYISIIVFLAHIQMSFGQLPGLSESAFDINPSVEAFTMTKYGRVSPSLNTGAFSFTIPIYTYKDPDFELPISLDYHYDGLKPSVHSGMAGMGWSLNYGGVITRTVRGIPDESGFNSNPKGFYYLCQDKTREQYLSLLHSKDWGWRGLSPSQESNYSLQTGFGIRYEMMGSDMYFREVYNNDIIWDTQPDIFHYSVSGRSGDFMFVPGGSIVVFNCNTPPGEISVQATVNYNTLNKPSFTLSFGDGFQYVFGPSAESRDYHYVHPNFNHEEESYYDLTPAAWYLTEIIAPNGRHVCFGYRSAMNAEFQVSVDRDNQALFDLLPYNHLEFNYQDFNYGSRLKASMTINALCNSVTVDGIEIISIDYSAKEKEEGFYHTQDIGPLSRGLPTPNTFTVNISPYSTRIDKVTVRSYETSDTLETVSLHHVYSSGQDHCRMFLKKVISRKNGRWVFNYNHENAVFPYNDTFGIDHWGYWTGQDALGIESTLPITGTYTSTTDLYDITSARDAISNKAYYGALSGISWPTGGKTFLFWEGNRAEHVLNRTKNTYPVLQHRPMNVGGIRISRIVNRDGNGGDYVTKYYYSDGQGNGSGELLYMPRYELRVSLFHPNGSVDCASYLAHSCLGLTRRNHICYTRVKELLPDSSFIVHHYSGYSSEPDGFTGHIIRTLYDYDSWNNRFIQHPVFPDSSGLRRMILPATNDRSSLRGIETMTEFFDSSGQKQRSTGHIYSLSVIDTITRIESYITNHVLIKEPIYYRKLLSSSDTTYFGNEYFTTVKEYSYNNYGQLKSESVFHPSLNEYTMTDYGYWHEGTHVESGGEGLPISLKWLRKGLLRGGVYYLKDEKRYSYSHSSSFLNPYPVLVNVAQINHPLQYDRMTWDGIEPSFRSYNIQYDSLNRVTLVQEGVSGGRWVRYGWDSNGRNLLWKETNESGYRWIYEWQDMVGLKTEEEPSGQKKYYKYDSQGRLSEEKDTEGNVVTRYNYGFFSD